jgi:hypothetical protein
MDDDDISEMVRWQLTGLVMKKAEAPKTAIPKCSNCGDDWHGLPVNGCEGSHIDTPMMLNT